MKKRIGWTVLVDGLFDLDEIVGTKAEAKEQMISIKKWWSHEPVVSLKEVFVTLGTK